MPDYEPGVSGAGVTPAKPSPKPEKPEQPRKTEAQLREIYRNATPEYLAALGGEDISYEDFKRRYQEVERSPLGDAAGWDESGNRKPMFAERPSNLTGPGADVPVQQIEYAPTPPKYPPGYLEQVALADWLKERAPSAEDLQYQAPTYSEESLGLPQESLAAQAEANPVARAAQQQTLLRMREQMQERGLGAEDRLALARIQQQTEGSRLRQERATGSELGARGMGIGGERMARNIDMANRLREQATGQEDPVVRGYGQRGAMATEGLGRYGAKMGAQTFGEEYETGGATDRLQRLNAAAGVRRGEDLRTRSNRAATQTGRSYVQSAELGANAARNYLNLGRTELGVRRGEDRLRADVERYNQAAEDAKPGWLDWTQGAGELIGGGVMTYFGVPGGPALMAKGGTRTAGNVEGTTNAPKKAKYRGYTYGGGS